MLQSFLAVTVVVGLLLAGEVLSQQCYNQSNCTGDVVPGVTTAEECCVGTDDGMSFHNGSCIVSQCIVHGFENARYAVTEREETEAAEGQDRVDTTFKLNVKGTTNFGSLTLIGDITSKAGPDTDTTDFQPFSTTDQTITAANDIAIQLFSRNDDITLEYNDTVILRFIVDSRLTDLIQQLRTAGEYIRDTAIVDIIDNDLLNINFRETDSVVNEGDLQGSIILRLRETQNPFTVTLHPVTIPEARDQDGFNVSDFVADAPADAQATPGADFNTTSITITIPNGTIEFEITYRFFFDDEVNEIDQSFALVGVVGDDVPDGLSCFQRRTGDPLCFDRTGGTTIKIEDNDAMIIGFNTSKTTTNETLGTVTIEVHSRIKSELDYEIGFRLSLPTDGHSATVETGDFIDPTFNPLSDIDARFGDRANPNNRLDPLETSRQLEKGRLLPRSPLVTTIFSDLRPEEDECYIIGILIIDTLVGGGRINYACNENEDNPADFFCEHTVCILDNDDPFEVGYVQTVYTVIEDEGPVRVCVNLTKPEIDIEEEMVFVESLDNSSSIYIPDDATLAMPDPFNFLTQSYDMIQFSDYEQQQLLSNHIRNIGINATRRLICYDQPIYDDMRLEVAEYFGMTLTVQIARTTVLTEVRPMYGEVAILIVDDDEAVVGLEKTFYSVTEDVGVVEVCAIVYSPNIVCPIVFPFGIRLLTGDASAESPMDYIGLSTNLNFLACETKQCVDVTIVDDEVLENVESFSVTLERTPGLDMRITLDPVDGVVEITDDDEAIVGLEKTLYQVSEDVGVVEVCAIVRSPPIVCPISFPFNVSLSTDDDSAVDPMDYLGVSTILMFEECERRRCVNVTIVDDEVLEMTESFHVTLERTLGLDDRITLDPVDGVVEITDDDAAVVGLERTFYNVSEDVGVVEVCAIVYSPTIDCPIAFPFDVSLSTSDNTAEEPMDYIGLSMDLSFAACETRQCVNIIIVDDLVDELDEEFDVTLERTIGLDSRISLRPVDARVVIHDNDVPIIVGHERTVYTTSEGGGQVELCVVIFEPSSGGAPREFNLTITTENGTAVAPDDYESVVGRVLQFNQNEVRKCYTININNDEICENMPNENFFSNLAYGSGVQPITVIRERAEVIIDDSLEPECSIRVGYERTVYTTTEDEGVVTLCAIIYSPLSGGTPRPFTVRYTTADDTAVSPQDYNSSTGILTFNTGDDRQCHDVDIVVDELCEEPSEQFFSNLALESGAPVTVDPPTAQVIIFEKCEPEVFVNDTLTGDPLMTVPIFNDPNVQQGDPVSSLCYEVHGESNQSFNLISDECTSVNAFYEKANTSSPNIDLNVVTQIGVTAVGNSGVCTNITVNLEGNCEALVNGGPPASGPVDGIHVKRYASSSRVRISVPNCGDTTLVMWVFCKSGQVEDPVTWDYFPVNFIRYVVMRGLSLDEKSHGLIGQFWNVPVTVTPHNGDFGGALRTDDYVITVDHPDSPPRSFVGLRSEVTWEFEKRVCYYVGNRQAGQLAEVSDPNDSVIEGVYSDYKVDSLFATDYVYSHFTECG